jgi:chromosome segregation ATPase
MESGRQTLGSIDQAVKAARDRVREAEQAMARTTTSLMQLEQSETEQYRALARLRADLLATGEIVQHLDASERTARAFLQQSERDLKALEQEIASAEQRLAALEATRQAREHAVDEAEENLDRAEGQTQRRLEQEPAYQTQLEAAQSAARTARHAEAKAAQARQDRLEKGRPYEGDPLFMYLWHRSYGTGDYKANPLARSLDRWVARLCGYAAARPNYAMLLEIPERLSEHAARAREHADQMAEAVRELERRAAERDGIPALRADLTSRERELAEVDDQIAEQHRAMQGLETRRTRFVAGEDEAFQRAIKVLATAFAQEDMVALREDARLTAGPEDDLVVEELVRIARERKVQESRLTEQRRSLETERQRVQELESIRLDFRRRGYDRRNSQFQDGALVALTLAQFLNGAMGRDGLWGEIRRQNRRRPRHSDPGFGSGGLGGFERGGAIWGRGGGGPSGGGGFRTGGGF